MVNFNIIEGAYTTKETYEKYKHLYLRSDLTIKQICEKLGISKHLGERYSRRVREETGQPRNPVKNYHHNNGSYTIRKWIDNHHKYFGTCKTEAEAQEHVQWLQEHNWNKKQYKEWRKTCK